MLHNFKRLVVVFTGIAVIMAFLLISLGFVDRLFVTKPDFTRLGPLEVLPDTAISATPAEGNSSDPAFTSGTSLGSLNAPVTITIYSDFLCSSCQQLALSTGKEIIEKYVSTGKVRMIYRYFITHGEAAILAAQAAECAAEEGRFWEFHDALMKEQPSEDDITPIYLQHIAREAGLDMTAFAESLDSGKFREKIIEDHQEARELGVLGSPTYYVNVMKGNGYQPFQAFRQVIEELLEKTVAQ